MKTLLSLSQRFPATPHLNPRSITMASKQLTSNRLQNSRFFTSKKSAILFAYLPLKQKLVLKPERGDRGEFRCVLFSYIFMTACDIRVY